MSLDALSLRDRAQFALIDRMTEERAHIIEVARETCELILGQSNFTVNDFDLGRRCLGFEIEGIQFRLTLRVFQGEDTAILETNKPALHTWVTIKELADLGALFMDRVPELPELSESLLDHSFDGA